MLNRLLRKAQKGLSRVQPLVKARNQATDRFGKGASFGSRIRGDDKISVFRRARPLAAFRIPYLLWQVNLPPALPDSSQR